MFQIIRIKSKFDFEYRRFSIKISKGVDLFSFDDFAKNVQQIHDLIDIPISICYISKGGDLLPINNENNMRKAFEGNLLRLVVSKKKDSWTEHVNESNVQLRKKKSVSTLLNFSNSSNQKNFTISQPMDFRRISAILDVNNLPESQRRVHLCKQEGDLSLGFYIKTNTVFRITHNGIVKMNGIFVSRLVRGGIAELSGLLSPNDEILEVNGISVDNKSLDQVADIMVANSYNLILTIKPGTPLPLTRNVLKRRQIKSSYGCGMYNNGFNFDTTIFELPESYKDSLCVTPVTAKIDWNHHSPSSEEELNDFDF
ncbi:LD29223p [Strongyloides ratti]|uniref:LD29223p n=1 Tax=Strongyloides ratti TaxID=34506 RepID=A0A090LKJ6_STRRB|nr:LD29223p [Strongyloides ratti]CEF70203.1 LD29223p [Strongyloides ratti]